MVFIGVLLATFVGVGIAAFYPGPKRPEPPLSIKYCNGEVAKEALNLAEVRAEQEKFDAEEKIYEEKSQKYNRDVSLISISALKG